MTSINEPPYTTATTARYNTDGTLDASFDDGGKLPGYSYLKPIYKQKDDKLWIYKPSEPQKPDSTLITRYTSEGLVDFTFGQKGSIFLPSYYSIIAEQANGKFIVTSNAGVSPNYKRVLYRLNNNGSLDTSFAIKNIKPEESLWMVIQDDDKIIIGGIDPEPSGNSSLVIKRYTAEGIIDSTFGAYGTIKTVVEPRKPHHAIEGPIWKNRLYLIGVVGGFDVIGFLLPFSWTKKLAHLNARRIPLFQIIRGCALRRFMASTQQVFQRSTTNSPALQKGKAPEQPAEKPSIKGLRMLHTHCKRIQRNPAPLPLR
jgi:uncharacterized delta-60 repeat protein